MLNRHEWASLLGIYALGAALYVLLLVSGFTLFGLVAGLRFMLTGLILGFCGAIIGRRSGHVIAGIIAGYVLFLVLVTTDYWLPGPA